MHRPLIWGHRGASGYAPENTLPSFAKAAAMGADGVELDIQMTKDGEIVVLHDETIDRTSTGKGWLKDFTLCELKKLNFNLPHPEYEHVEIPTMAEVFELLKPTGLTINIELKTGIVFYPGLVDKILDLTARYGMEDRVIYSSFNHRDVVEIHRKNPSAETGFLYEDGPLGMPDYALKYGIHALHPALYNLQYPGLTEECREKNIPLNVWTVNTTEHLLFCCRAGVHAVITNYPDRAADVIRSYERTQKEGKI